MKTEHLNALTPDERFAFKALRSKRTKLRNALKNVRKLRAGYGEANRPDFDAAIESALRSEESLDRQISEAEALARLRYEAGK